MASAISDETREKIELMVQIAELTAECGEPNDDELREIMALIGDDTSQNANAFVPWSDPNIPYQCECGSIIYADTEHEH